MKITLLIKTVVGAIIIDSSHGNNFSSPSSPPPLFCRWRRRSRTSVRQMTISSVSCNDNYLSASESGASSSSSSILSSYSSSIRKRVMTCARGGGGGGMDDDDDAQYQQRRQRRDGDGDRDDRPAPRRSSPPYNRYDDRDERDYRSRPRPRDDDARGPPSRSDRRAAAGGVGGSRPSQQQGGRERRDNRFDTRMGDVDDDRSSQWDSRDRERSSSSRGGDRRDYYDERDRRERNPSRSNRPTNTGDVNVIRGESATVAKRKSWFTSKKDTAKAPPSDGVKIEHRRGLDAWDNNVSPFPPPPPPPPPPFPPPPPTDESLSNMDINPAQTDRVPIHYMFPTADTAATERQISDIQMNDDEINMEKSAMGEEDAMDVPFLDVAEEFVDRDRGRSRRRIRDDDEDVDDELQYRRASPRRDAVTIFMSTRRGAMKVRVGSMIVGAAIGGFIGKVRHYIVHCLPR